MAPCPPVVAVVIFAAVVAAKTPFVSVARPSALISLIILPWEYAAMMLREGVSGIYAGSAIIADAAARLCAGDPGGERDKNQT